MIVSFACKDAEKIFLRAYTKRFPPEILERALDSLIVLDAAFAIRDDANTPGTRLEKLKGKQKHQYSMRINDQWRLCFVWKDGHAHNVEIVDYH